MASFLTQLELVEARNTTSASADVQGLPPTRPSGVMAIICFLVLTSTPIMPARCEPLGCRLPLVP